MAATTEEQKLENLLRFPVTRVVQQDRFAEVYFEEIKIARFNTSVLADIIHYDLSRGLPKSVKAELAFPRLQAVFQQLAVGYFGTTNLVVSAAPYPAFYARLANENEEYRCEAEYEQGIWILVKADTILKIA